MINERNNGEQRKHTWGWHLASSAPVHFCDWLASLSGCILGQRVCPKWKSPLTLPESLTSRACFSGVLENIFGYILAPLRAVLLQGQWKESFSQLEYISLYHSCSILGRIKEKTWWHNLFCAFWTEPKNWTTFLFLKVWSLVPNQVLCPSHPMTSPCGLEN